MSDMRMRGIDPAIVVGRLRARGRVGTLVATWLDLFNNPFISLPNQLDVSSISARLNSGEYAQGMSRDSEATGINNLFCQGNYFLAIIDGGEKIETANLSATLLSGVYFDTIVYHDLTTSEGIDSGTLSAALLNGVYFATVVSTDVGSDSSNLSAALLSGLYLDVVRSTDDQVNSTTLSAQLVSGAYTHV